MPNLWSRAVKLAFITKLSSSAKAELANELEVVLEYREHGVHDECPHCEQEARFAVDDPLELETPTKDFLQQLIDALREP